MGRNKDGGGPEPVPVPWTDGFPQLWLWLHHTTDRTGPLQLPDAGWGRLSGLFSSLHAMKCGTGCCHFLLTLPADMLCLENCTADFDSRQTTFMFLVCQVCVTHLNLIVAALVYFSSVSFFSLPHVASSHPNKVYCTPLKKQGLKKKILCPWFNSMQVQTDSQCSPLAHPPKMATSRGLLCTAAMAASLSSPLKSISTDGKKMAGT